MELYGNGHSPTTQSIRMLCRELQIECDYFEIGLGATEPWLPEPLNPDCRSPMLEDDGFLLAEANAILIYLAEHTPSPQWYSSGLNERALTNQWLNWQSSRLAPQVAQLAWQTRYAPDLERDEQLSRQTGKWLGTLLPELEQQLQNQGRLGAAHLSIADLAIAHQMDDLMVSGYDLAPYPSSIKWLGQIASRPTFAVPSDLAGPR